MAIAVNAVTSVTSTTAEASFSVNHTCAGSDRLLLVIVSAMKNSADGLAISTCTWGGSAMTLATTRQWNDTNRTRTYREAIYYVVNPGTTQQAVAVTTSANSSATVVAAVSLTGVLQSGAIGATAGNDLVNTTAVSQALTTTAANSWIVGGVMARQPNSTATTFSPGTDTNEWYDLSSGDTATSDISTTGGYRLVATAGASSIAWTASNAIYGVMVAVEVKASGAATQDIAPSGLAVAVGKGGPTVWNHRIVATVGAGGDDARQDNGGVVVTGAGTIFVHVGAPIGAYIVRDLHLPDGPVVTGAWSRLYANTTSYDSPGVTVRAEAAPADFAATTNNLSARTKTTAGVTWNASNLGVGTHDSPDIRTVVQEALADGDWNGDLAVFLIDNGTGGQFDFNSFEAGTGRPQLIIEWQFGGIAPDGKAVGVASGTAVVTRGAVSVAPSGKAVAVGLGTAVVARGAVSVAPAGKAVAVGKGTAVVTRGTVSVAPSGKAVAVGAGTAVVTRGAVAIAPSGLAVAVGKGTAAIGLGLAPSGKAVAVGLGGATVGRGAVGIAPSGKAVGLGLGTPSVGVGVQNVAPAGLSAAVGLGTAVVGRGAVSVAPAGKAVAVGLGAASVAFPTLDIAPSGKAVAVVVGTAIVETEGPQGVAPAGLAVGLALGTTGVAARGIGVNAVTTYSSSESLGSWSFNHSGGGVHRMAAVIVHGMRTAVGVVGLSATYGGAAMTAAVAQQYPDTPRTRTYVIAIFTLANPPTGSQTVEITSSFNLSAVVASAVTLTNICPTAAIGGSSSGNVIGSATAGAPAISGLAGGWLLGGATMRGGDLYFTPAEGVVELYDEPSGTSTTADITATAGYRRLTSALATTWATDSNALDYGVVAAVEFRQAQVVYPLGLALGVVPGAVVVEMAAIQPEGLAVAAGVGSPAVALAGTLIAPAGLALGALGEPTVEIGGVTVAAPSVAVPLELGAAAVAQVMTAEGLAVALAIGDGALAESSSAVAPAGLAVGVGMGAARVWSHRLIVAVAEDGYETPAGVVFLNTTSLNVEVNQPWVAMATAALDVPQGVTVVTTRLNLQTISHDDPQLEAACELDAAPATLTTAANNISGRSLTVARARWEAANVGLGVVNSPNFGAAAQEVVLLPEWEPGGRLMFVLRDLTAGGWLRWYSADAAAGLRPTVTVEWQFGAADLTLEPSGLAVAAAMGEAVVGGGAVGVTADGLAVAVGIGGAVVGGGAVGIVADGLAVTLALGEAVVTGGALDIAPEGLASFVVVGDAALGQLVAPAGLGLGAIGSVTVSRATIGIVVEGVAVGLGLGEAVVLAGGALLRPAGVAAAAAFGTAVVGRGGVGVTAEALGVGVASGTAVVGLGGVGIAPEGVAAAVAFGTAVVGSGVATVAAGGLPVTVGSGAAAVGHGLVVDGLAVGMTSGTAVMGNGVAVGGLAVGVTSGSADVAITLQRVTVGGLSVGALVGLAMVALARQPWPLTVRPRGNGLTLAERDNGLTLRARDNELTVEDRME